MSQGQGLEVVGVRAVVAGFDDYVRKTAQVGRSTKQMSGAVAKSGTSFGASAKRIAEFATAIVGVDVGLRTINKAFRSTIGASIGFESAFAGVRKTVDATEDQFQLLSDGLRDMSKEIPLSVNGLAAISEAAGQLGIKTENILDFTETMAMLGETTNLSADQAATSLARLANITQLPQDQFDNLGSTIVDLGNNFATTEAEITAFGLRIAGAGSQIGLTQAEILAFGTALSSVGINAEAGGTAISRVFVEIDKAVRQGSDSLTEFAKVAGLSADEFVKAYQTDAAGAITTFIEGLGDISEAGGDVFAVLETLELDSIRVQDALLRSAGAGDLLREALGRAGIAFEENTALQAEFAQRAETSAAQFQVLRNRVNDLGISVGDNLVPPLLSGATAFTGWIEALQVLAPILPTVAAAVGALVAVLAAQKLLAFAQGIIAMSQAAGTAAIAGGPLLALIAGVVALDIALRAITGDGLLENVAKGMTLIFGDQSSVEASTKALDAWNVQIAIAAAGVTDLDVATGLLDSAIADFEKNAGTAVTTTGEFWISMAKGELFTKSFGDALLGSDRRLFGLNVGLSESQDRFKDLQEIVRLAAQEMLANDASVGKLILAYNKLPPELRDVFNEVTNVEAILGDLDLQNSNAIASGGFLGDAFQRMQQTALEAAGGIQAASDAVVGFTAASLGEFAVIDAFGQWQTDIAAAGSELDQLITGLKSAKAPAEFIEGLFGVFDEGKARGEKAGKDLADGLRNGLRSGGGGAIKEAEILAEDAISAFTSVIAATAWQRDLNERFGEAGGAVIAAFFVAVEETTEQNGDVLGQALQRLFDRAEDLGIDLSTEAGQNIMNALAAGIELGTPEAIEAALAAVMDLTNTFEQGAQTALDVFQVTLGQIRADRDLEDKFGAKGADIMKSLQKALAEGGESAAGAVARDADRLVQILADRLSPKRAGEIGARLFAALTAALASGGDAVLTELNAILAEINSLLGDEDGGRVKGTGGKVPQGALIPIPGAAPRPGLSLERIISIFAKGGPAIQEAIASIRAGIFSFGSLEDASPRLANAVQSSLARLGFDIPTGPESSAPVTVGGIASDPSSFVSSDVGGGAGPFGAGDTNVTIDLSGSVFNGTPEENADAIGSTVEDILADEQTVGAFNSGVG